MMERKMKDSGIPWIGEIPEEWEIGRAKEMFHHEQRSVRKEDEIVTCFRDGQVTLRKNRRVEGFTEALQEFGYQGIRKNDLVIHQMDAFAGSIGVSDSDGKGSPILICCTPNGEYNTWYYCRLLRVMANQGWIKALYKGIRERSTDFRYDTFSQQMLPIPPYWEQEKIATWLDEKCSEIDELIDVEQKMIGELEAYRKAIIIETVTRGLNPAVAMKKTNLPWVPEIPKHWKVCRLKDLCLYIKDGTHFSPTTTADGFPYITAGDVRGVGIDFSKTKRISEKDFKALVSAGCAPQKGDVLIVKDGATTGRTGLLTSNDKCVLLSSVAMLKSKYNNYWLMYLLSSELIQAQILLSMAGSAMPRITLTKLNNFVGLYVPLDEQQAIADYLDTKCKEIDDLIAVKREKIETLKQYRQSLIFEAVTGKIQIA